MLARSQDHSKCSCSRRQRGSSLELTFRSHVVWIRESPPGCLPKRNNHLPSERFCNHPRQSSAHCPSLDDLDCGSCSGEAGSCKGGHHLLQQGPQRVSAESREDARPQGERGDHSTYMKLWDVHGNHGDRQRTEGFEGQAEDPGDCSPPWFSC